MRMPCIPGILLVLFIHACQPGAQPAAEATVAEDTSLALEHRWFPAREKSGRPPVLFLLHGYGSHEADLAGIAQQIDPRYAVVAVRAPITLQPGAYAWYHLQWEQGQVVGYDAEGARNARQQLTRFIDQVVADHQANPEKVVLLGFSQGAIMSLEVALTAPEKVCGIAMMSGLLNDHLRQDRVAEERLQGMDILVTHGTEDAVIPVEKARICQQFLDSLPVQLHYQEYPGGHTITADAMQRAFDWTTGLLDASSPSIKTESR
ncbi:MAG: alpha/beta hydrolase-fold protein [Bacteroidota bacterium]